MNVIIVVHYKSYETENISTETYQLERDI